MKRFPNGYGGITKLSGKRRNPFMAYINQEITQGDENPELKKQLVKLRAVIDSDADYSKLLLEVFKNIDKIELLAFLDTQISKCEFKATYKKTAIGYFKTYKDASICLAEYNKNPYDVKQKHTFAEVFELAFADNEKRLSAKSIEAYRRSFNKCSPIHDKNISDLKLIDLQTIIDAENGKSKSVQNQIITVMRLTYEYAIKYELAVKDYSKHLKIGDINDSKVKNIFTPEEIRLLWEHKDFVTPQHKMEIASVVLILLYTGVRINELLGIQLTDIDGDIIHVRGTKNKTSDRIIPVHPDIQPLIDARIKNNKQYLIESTEQEYFSANPIRYVDLVYLNSQLNMNHIFHECRHTFASYSMGMNPVLRAYILGHKNHNITDDVYTHPEQLIDQLREEIRKYKPC